MKNLQTRHGHGGLIRREKHRSNRVGQPPKWPFKWSDGDPIGNGGLSWNSLQKSVLRCGKKWENHRTNGTCSVAMLDYRRVGVEDPSLG